MIERLDPPHAWAIPRTGGTPPMLSKERAYLECGCSIYIGLAIDGGPSPPEPTVITAPCSEEHVKKMADFNDAFIGSLEASPQARPAVEVADELLVTLEASIDLG